MLQNLLEKLGLGSKKKEQERVRKEEEEQERIRKEEEEQQRLSEEYHRRAIEEAKIRVDGGKYQSGKESKHQKKLEYENVRKKKADEEKKSEEVGKCDDSGENQIELLGDWKSDLMNQFTSLGQKKRRPVKIYVESKMAKKFLAQKVMPYLWHDDEHRKYIDSTFAPQEYLRWVWIVVYLHHPDPKVIIETLRFSQEIKEKKYLYFLTDPLPYLLVHENRDISMEAAKVTWQLNDASIEAIFNVLSSQGMIISGIEAQKGRHAAEILRDCCPPERRKLFEQLSFDRFSPSIVKVKDESYENIQINDSSKAIPNNLQNSIGIEFVLIPAGEFDMGTPSSEVEGKIYDSGPVHHVKILTAFYMGKYQVTQKQWRSIMGNNPSDFKGDNLPVEMVSWYDVQDFIKKLNQKESTNKYRLPSEAEWEYAARAGTKTRYFFGDDESMLEDYAWYSENSGSRPPKKGDYYGYDEDDLFQNKWNGKTHAVGEKKPNQWGLYDIYGNVDEWVQDNRHINYNGAPTDGGSWESRGDRQRVYRGGYWMDQVRICTSARRGSFEPDVPAHSFGFRLLRVL